MTSCISSQLGNPSICSGNGLKGQDLFDYWCSHDCVSAFSILLNTNTNGTLGYNPKNLPQVQGYFTNLFNTYNETNQITDVIDSNQYNVFQNTLIEACANPRLPGACDSYLGKYCSFSRDDLANSPIKQKFCGCYVTPDPNYLKYTNNPACDPFCHRVSTVQKATATTGEFVVCDNNVCVIDDVTIQINESTVGGVTFANICPACGDAQTGCTCIIAGVDISETLSRMGVGTQFQQLCGPNSTCLTGTTVSNLNPVPCSSVSAAPTPIPHYSGIPSPFFFGIIILVLVILILFLYVAYRGEKEE